MGIQGLLPLMKSIMVPIHIKQLNGCTVAVDTYSWLHKGALCCSKELCLGLPTSRHIDYCMHRVNLLRHYGVKPILVFDGGLLPMKSDEEAKRSRARKENLERAVEHESAGNSAAAYECYQKAVDISPSVARELIEVLKEENVDYIVAPYEADAQMAFLSLNNRVEAIITEDSDLIPFGCSRIIFKMDKFGQGVEFRFSMIQRNKDLNLASFTKQMVLEMCILSGCDYLQSLPGMGLKRAHALVQKFKSYNKVIKHLRYSAISVPPLYEEDFKKALLTFQHQRVYDPTSEDIVHLTDIPCDLGSDLDFLGPLIPQSVVNGIAKGDLDPLTKLPFQGKSISERLVNDTYSVKEFKLGSKRKKPDSSAQNNILTKYFCLASLEAKRNLRVAKSIHKHSQLMQEPAPIIRNHSSEPSSMDEAAIGTMTCSPVSLTGSQNLEDLLPLKVPVETCITATVKKLSEFPHCVDPKATSIFKENLYCSEPTAALQRAYDDPAKPSMSPCQDHESMSAPKDVDDRAGKRKVIVRSRFFKSNILDKNDSGRENSKSDVEKEGGGLAPCRNTIPNRASPELDEDEHVYESEKCVVEKQDASFVPRQNTIHQNLILGNNGANNSLKERKSSSSQRIQSGASKMNRAPTYSIHLGASNGIPDNKGKSTETDNKEGNFGCDVSHLSRYSDISEKSMERFVSVISSFRYTGSGSRASGLRAPLKDVQNTGAVRLPTVPVDFSKFAYVPKARKTASAGRGK